MISGDGIVLLSSILVTCWAVMLFWRYVVRRILFRQRGLEQIARSAVVITGCDSGFGRLIALKFEELGATVYAGCLKESSCVELNMNSKNMRAFLCDVRKDRDVANALSLVKKSGLPLAAIINNAGISAFGWAEVLDLKTYQKNMDVNFFGTVRMTRAFLPLLRRDRGRLINMGSIGARMPSAFGSAYLSTKAAMCSYSDCVRQEMHRFGVSVSLIEPGFFSTGLLTSGAAAGGKISCLSSGKKVDFEQNTGCEAALEGSVYPPYAEKMERTAKPIRQMEWLNGFDCSWVVSAVEDAAVNHFPLATYTVGYDARLIRHCLAFLPAWFIDWAQSMQD